MAVGNASGVFVREELAAQLTDAALKLAARHGVHGGSVDQELDFWKAMNGAVRARRPKVGTSCPPQSMACRDRLAAELSDAVYDVILERGFAGSFLDVRLDLWSTLRQELSHGRSTERARSAC